MKDTKECYSLKNFHLRYLRLLYKNWDNFDERVAFLSNMLKAVSMFSIFDEELIVRDAVR